MLELKDEFLEIKFKEAVHRLRYPTVRDSKLLRSWITEKGEDEALLSWLELLGMQLSFAEQLSGKHIEAIIGELNSKKK